jgi:nicotinamidase-related amidase
MDPADTCSVSRRIMTRAKLARGDDSVLVLVDIQERLGAAMAPTALAGVIRNARILLQAAMRLETPALVTEQYPKGLGPLVAELAELLPAGTPRMEKTRFSIVGAGTEIAPFQSALEARGREQVILAGMESHVCVLQSALELQAADREVFVVEDACCSRTERNHAIAMERLRQAGVIVTSTESVVFEWMRDARHEQFKALSALVR